MHVGVEHHSKFQAAYVLLMLTCFFVWHRVGLWTLGKARLAQVLLSEYFALYLFFLWMLADSLGRALPRIPYIALMGPADLEAQFEPFIRGNTSFNSTAVLSAVSLEQYPLLKWASLASPVPVVLTWMVCLWDTLQHAFTMCRGSSLGRMGSDESHLAHDRAVRIIALPTAFALMSLSAVTRVWDVVCNSFSDDVSQLESWEERKSIAFKFYEAHYQIADLYEAWALFHFGRLALEVVQRRFRSMAIWEEGEDPFGPERDLQGNVMKLATAMHSSVQSLTMQGIWAFVIVCLVESLYGVANPMLQLFLRQMELHNHPFVAPVLRAMEEDEVKVGYVFVGMGLVASTAAIGNIVQVERVLHQELEEFRPFWKFWGTKVLVSFAFMQEILVMLPIPPFSSMSEVHSKLFYSTALCYECLGVSLLHLHAWRPGEAWYDDAGSPRVPVTADPFWKEVDAPEPIGKRVDDSL